MYSRIESLVDRFGGGGGGSEESSSSTFKFLSLLTSSIFFTSSSLAVKGHAPSLLRCKCGTACAEQMMRLRTKSRNGVSSELSSRRTSCLCREGTFGSRTASNACRQQILINKQTQSYIVLIQCDFCNMSFPYSIFNGKLNEPF